MKAAPRHIPATPDDLTGWCGRPVRVCGKCGSKNIRIDCSMCGDSTFDHHCDDGCRDCGGPEVRAFDVADAAHRDHLIRRYALPDWHRDTPGGLTPEQSAAVVLGSVLRVRAGLCPVKSLVIPRSPSFGEPTSFRVSPPYSGLGGGALAEARRDDKRRGIVPGWSWGVLVGTYRVNGVADTGPEAQAAAERAVVNLDAALLTPTGILLPQIEVGGEPVLWSIP